MRNIYVSGSSSGVLNYYDNTISTALPLFSFPQTNRDVVYVFDKITKEGRIFGEIQNDFSIGFTIDGSKDSYKAVVLSFEENSIEPNTIVYHLKTNSWWIVDNDRKQRFQNDSGFLYEHEIDLIGGIELFNARDLTDSGFYQKTYTLGNFIARLLQLSNLEYAIKNVYTDLNANLEVTFIKQYQNYTLLSALRDILDSYNYCPKLRFHAYNDGGVPRISSFDLTLIPKTGSNETPLDINHFDDVRETSIFNRNSFGSTVVSNAENVISTKAKTYPLIGSAKLVSDGVEVLPENAFINLPSDVYFVNWLKLHLVRNIKIDYGENFLAGSTIIPLTSTSQTSIDKFIGSVLEILSNETYFPYGNSQAIINNFYNSLDTLIEKLKKGSTVTLWGGNNYNPDTQKVVKGKNTLYIPVFNPYNNLLEPNLEMTIIDKENGNTLPTVEQGIWYERGSDKITHFNFLREWKTITTDNTDLQDANNVVLSINSSNYGLRLTVMSGFPLFNAKHVSCSINYIPMGDIKIKVDNETDKRDIQLYNQNGKLTDSDALSKLINSYATEISSDNITKYKTYTSFSDVPNVGRVVLNNGTRYVINNLSLTFSHNDGYSYLIECQVSLSKQYAVKSLMVNPNTNIRDYGIPQSFNVKRKQLYRDYYELDYVSQGNVGSSYLGRDKIFRFSDVYHDDLDFVCFIKTTYAEAVNGSTTWYYRLEPTRYDMNKMFYLVLDFKDNNIIGYDVQNIFGGFDLTKLITGLNINKNTPVSYVDLEGKIEDIEILYLDNTSASACFSYYQEINSSIIGDYDLSNNIVFIPQVLYELAEEVYVFKINEENYKKDPIETPVFEYSCQIGNSENILVGDYILSQHENCVYFYTYVIGNVLSLNSVYDSQPVEIVSGGSGLRVSNAVEITTVGGLDYIRLKLHSIGTYDFASKLMSYGSVVPHTVNQDLAVFRIAYDLTNGNVYRELMFIAKDVPAENITNDELKIYENFYKLN